MSLGVRNSEIDRLLYLVIFIGILLLCSVYHIFHKRNENLPLNPGDPLVNVSRIMQNRSSTFSVNPVHPDTIIDIISKMKNTKTVGTDNIDSFIIKLAKEELAPAITHIVNLSISSRKFPRRWKTAKVVPLHKKEDKTLPKNYRPVALLPVLSKILEKLWPILTCSDVFWPVLTCSDVFWPVLTCFDVFCPVLMCSNLF